MTVEIITWELNFLKQAQVEVTLQFDDRKEEHFKLDFKNSGISPPKQFWPESEEHHICLRS